MVTVRHHRAFDEFDAIARAMMAHELRAVMA